MTSNSESAVISRRHFLRGLGATLALPTLSSLPRNAFATGAAMSEPLRLCFVFVPNGMHMADWTPAKTGPLSQFKALPKTLQSLAPLKDKFSVLSGLALDNARAHGDGPGDHARAAACYLTGMHPVKTGGADIRVGVSVDQVAAGLIGVDTRFKSLELGVARSRMSGRCDSGYSCAYSSNISWRKPNLPNAKEIVPDRLFQRLFRNAKLSKAQRQKQKKQRQTVLDAVLEDARSLKRGLVQSDREKLTEYLEAIHEVEQRLQRTEVETAELTRGVKVPERIPRDYGEHIDVMYDMIRLAFQSDTTRVVSFMVGNAGSNRSYRKIGVKEGHHYLSHHGRDEQKQQKIATINRFHVERFSRFLHSLDKVQTSRGTLLDNTIVVFGSAIGDGNRHNHNDLPILVAGGKNKNLSLGQHLQYKKNTPLCELYMSILRLSGWRGTTFGDASKPLSNFYQML